MRVFCVLCIKVGSKISKLFQLNKLRNYNDKRKKAMRALL